MVSLLDIMYCDMIHMCSRCNLAIHCLSPTYSIDVNKEVLLKC